MSRISFMGSYSGIDRSQIDAIMEAERQPFVRMSQKKENIISQQNGWKDVNTRLNNLYDKIKVLEDPKTFASKSATSSREDFVSMTVSEKAIDGDYRINIKQIATNSRIVGEKVSGDIAEGDLVIENADGEKVSIEIKEGDSLKDVANKINELTLNSKDEEGNTVKGSGIKATIIDNRLVLEDSKSGKRDIKLGGNARESLGLSGENNLEEGQKAIFTINGIEVESDSNKVDNVIEGVTINIKKAHEGNDTDTVKVGTDYEKAEKAMEDFVEQYNSTMNFLKDQTKAGDPEIPGSAGKLAGDGSLIRIQSDIRTAVNGAISSEGSDIKNLGELGIATFDRYGDLKFDSAKFKEAMDRDPESVKNFFSNRNEDNEKVGFVATVNKRIDQFISKSNGVVKTKNEGFDRALKDINLQIERFTERMDRKEEYYITMFSKLDVAMMQAESQMDWLMGQVSAMNAQAKK